MANRRSFGCATSRRVAAAAIVARATGGRAVAEVFRTVLSTCMRARAVAAMRAPQTGGLSGGLQTPERRPGASRTTGKSGAGFTRNRSRAAGCNTLRGAFPAKEKNLADRLASQRRQESMGVRSPPSGYISLAQVAWTILWWLHTLHAARRACRAVVDAGRRTVCIHPCRATVRCPASTACSP